MHLKFFTVISGCHFESCVTTSCETRLVWGNTPGIERPSQLKRSCSYQQRCEKGSYLYRPYPCSGRSFRKFSGCFAYRVVCPQLVQLTAWRRDSTLKEIMLCTKPIPGLHCTATRCPPHSGQGCGRSGRFSSCMCSSFLTTSSTLSNEGEGISFNGNPSHRFRCLSIRSLLRMPCQ